MKKMTRVDKPRKGLHRIVCKGCGKEYYKNNFDKPLCCAIIKL